MKKEKRWCFFVLVLSFSVLAAMDVAAGGNGGQTGAGEKPMEIVWLEGYPEGVETSWFEEEIERKFNVDIVLNGVRTNDPERQAAMMASGDIPDCGAFRGQPYELWLDGITRSIPKAMMLKHAPNYAKLFDQYPIGWLILRSPDNDDEYVALTGFNAGVGFGPWTLGFRVDWAKKVGVELPGYDKGKVALDNVGEVYFYDYDVTLDWLEDLLVKFRDGDPDGNGKRDTIPYWGMWNKKILTWGAITGAFDVNVAYSYFNHMVDGKFYMRDISPKYKEFLKHMAKWYKMDLIDKEWPTLTHHKAREKAVAGMLAVWTIDWDHIDPNGDKTYPPSGVLGPEDVQAGAEVVMLPPVVGPNGEQGAPVYDPMAPLGGYPWEIGNQVTDEKLAKILEIFDYMWLFSDEVWIQRTYGKPGVHFDWEGQPMASRPIRREFENVPEGYPKLGQFPSGYPGFDMGERSTTFRLIKKLAAAKKKYVFSDYGEKNTLRPYKYDVFGETKIPDLNLKYRAVLDTLYDEFMLKAIQGEIDIDAEWDNYVAKWRQSGGDAITAEWMKAPILDEVRKGNRVY